MLLLGVAEMSNHLLLERPATSVTGPSNILCLAHKIEPNVLAVIAWYREVPINELGGQCAQQLVAQGHTDAVIAFLTAIVSGKRD